MFTWCQLGFSGSGGRLSARGEEFYLRKLVPGYPHRSHLILCMTLGIVECGWGGGGELWTKRSKDPQGVLFPSSPHRPTTESAGSLQPLVVLHAHPASIAEGQCGSPAALCLLPGLRGHEPLLYQYTSCRRHSHCHRQCQPRGDGALQGSPRFAR